MRKTATGCLYKSTQWNVSFTESWQRGRWWLLLGLPCRPIMTSVLVSEINRQISSRKLRCESNEIHRWERQVPLLCGPDRHRPHVPKCRKVLQNTCKIWKKRSAIDKERCSASTAVSASVPRWQPGPMPIITILAPSVAHSPTPCFYSPSRLGSSRPMSPRQSH